MGSHGFKRLSDRDLLDLLASFKGGKRTTTRQEIVLIWLIKEVRFRRRQLWLIADAATADAGDPGPFPELVGVEIREIEDHVLLRLLACLEDEGVPMKQDAVLTWLIKEVMFLRRQLRQIAACAASQPTADTINPGFIPRIVGEKRSPEPL